jgi:hypothetical protein
MSESPFNPVAAALGNAIRRAVGRRPFETPFSRDRIWRLLADPAPTTDDAATDDAATDDAAGEVARSGLGAPAADRRPRPRRS